MKQWDARNTANNFTQLLCGKDSNSCKSTIMLPHTLTTGNNNAFILHSILSTTNRNAVKRTDNFWLWRTTEHVWVVTDNGPQEFRNSWNSTIWYMAWWSVKHFPEWCSHKHAEANASISHC